MAPTKKREDLGWRTKDDTTRFSKVKVLMKMMLPGWRVEMTPAEG